MQKLHAIDTVLLKSKLLESGSEFLCFSVLPGKSANVLFIGRFDDREVVWNSSLYSRSKQGGCSFMEITPGTGDNMLLRIELAVAMIDETIIRKAIIMIRNYKRLRLGRHEWGQQGVT